MNGIVKEYDKKKEFGFILGEDGEGYFVHLYGFGFKLKQSGLRAGQRVSFDIDFGIKGDKAINVRPS